MLIQFSNIDFVFLSFNLCYKKLQIIDHSYEAPYIIL